MNDCSRTFLTADVRPADEMILADRLARMLFTVVPESYATYCAFTSRVVVGVLRRLGIAAQLAPCQLWHVTPNSNHAVGFLGMAPQPRRWDGHVVCLTPTLLFDAAVRNLERDFHLPVPTIVIAPRFRAPSQVIARQDLNRDQGLWWHNPPPDADTSVPDEPMELVNGYVRELTEALDAPF